MQEKKTLTDWQVLITEAANKKFPNNVEWTQHDRLSSIQEQLNDLVGAVEVEEGSRVSDDHAHQDPDHRIAALIADILILAEMRKTEVEIELRKVLRWFNSE